MKTSRWIHGGLMLSALVFAGTAFAQSDAIPRRIDPDPPSGVGMPTAWSFFDVTGGAPRATLGKLAVDAWGGVYVWAIRQELIPPKAETAAVADEIQPRREVPDPVGGGSGGPAMSPLTGEAIGPTPRRADPGEPAWPNEGLGGPQVPVQTTAISTLYYLNGGTLAPEFEVRGETGASVFVAKSGDVFVATELEDGSVHAYRRHARVWRQDDLPAGVRAPAEAMAGGNTVFFRTGDRVLRHTGEHWKEEFSCADLPAMGGLVSLGRDQVMAPCGCGRHVFNGKAWIENLDDAAPHVHGLWGGRDAMGDLHLFAAGCNTAHTTLQIFQFIENGPGVLTGKFDRVAVDPLHGESVTGTAGQAVWGSGVHDIYLAGAVDQSGHLYHFDGARWNNITPVAELPPMLDVAGTRWGDLWVSLADGRLLHRRAEDAPVGGTPEAPALARDVPVEVGSTTPMLAVSRDPSGVATARFALTDPGPVSLEVFDLAGRSVATLEDGVLPAGAFSRTWDTSRVSSGVYFCRLRSGTVLLTRKLLVHR